MAKCKGTRVLSRVLGALAALTVFAIASPSAVAQNANVDCSDKRFSKSKPDVPVLLRWTELALQGLDGLQPHEKFRVKANCDRALEYAGTAYCRATSEPKPLAALARVKKTCAAARAKFAAAEKKQADDQKASVAAAKAKRKTVRFPKSSYRGGQRRAVTAAMKRALVAPKLAKSPREILRVHPMGGWKKGRYRGTRVAFQQIMGTVLWHDKDNDGVCRFVSYNFVKERKGGSWSKLRVKSFCMGCPEGWTKCR